MSSIICTLFEGHYHYGVAALTNSLYRQGYRGVIYAGYRGELPPWAKNSTGNAMTNWAGSSNMAIAQGLDIIFLPIVTEFHLTNYKPFFMLQLLEEFIPEASSVTYFDPDIIVKCNWSFFETWMSHGVSLVHEISYNDMPATHPLRMEWSKVIKKADRKITRHLHSYINGGFCSITKKNIEFLETWAAITNMAISHFGLSPGQWAHNLDRTALFHSQDQDTLNITAMCSESPISEMGPEAMDFIYGGFTMSHCTGSPKPWRKNYFLSALKGHSPLLADKSYWDNIYEPLSLYDSKSILINKISISVASLIGRFYRRS